MLRILSYNIRHGKGMDGNINLERIAEVISKTSPDLVALQEVDKCCKRSGHQDIAAELGRLLDMQHRFGPFMTYEGGEYGMAILSRLPITDTVRHPLPEGAEPRCALEVKVQAGGVQSPISFVCIHNDWTSEKVRVQQIQALLAFLHNTDHPIILAGDFNGEQTDESMELLRETQWTVLDKKGEKTCPSNKPEVEIDFFVMRGFPGVAIDHDVIDEKLASDHKPIYAVITLQNENINLTNKGGD